MKERMITGNIFFVVPPGEGEPAAAAHVHHTRSRCLICKACLICMVHIAAGCLDLPPAVRQIQKDTDGRMRAQGTGGVAKE